MQRGDEGANSLEERLARLEENQNKISKAINRKSTVVLCMVSAMMIIIGMIGTGIIHPVQNVSEYTQYLVDTPTSGYVIENLKGDKINTYVSWRLEPDQRFHINVLDSPLATEERLNAINDVIFSEETVTVNNETYYMGWFGALKDVAYTTKIPIPIHYRSIVSSLGTGQVTIMLTNERSGDGYSGFTKSQVDEANHQILKSQITIYNVDALSTEEFKDILRHEMGHALGLAHSQESNDLMYREIRTNYPYVSPCDIQGLIGLYDGNQKSEIICK